jgi:SpoVK/Ycf46/Vps4 family AAA+-type ATPase
LISGNRGTGKALLALAAINALGTAFLNFSPAVLIGKELPSPRVLVLMVMKAAQILAPNVILVDDIQKMFGRGTRLSDASKKFKAQLRRQVRRVRPKDRILLIRTASAALPKSCTSLFSRVIDILKPDFATMVAIWNFWLKKKNLMLPTISVNTLAFGSDRYTGGSIARCCSKRATVKMSRTKPNNPITNAEVINFLGDAPEDESTPRIEFSHIDDQNIQLSSRVVISGLFRSPNFRSCRRRFPFLILSTLFFLQFVWRTVKFAFEQPEFFAQTFQNCSPWLLQLLGHGFGRCKWFIHKNSLPTY